VPIAPAALVTHKIVRAFAVGLLVLLAVGGIPGSALRSVVHDRVAQPPPVPADVQLRDGTVDVAVHDGQPGDGRAGGAPLAGAHVRALAILEGRAYLAGSRDTDAGGRARMSGLPRGEVWILAEAPGRARGATHLAVDAAPREVTIALEPEHAIDVVVKDERGLPVPDAEIEVVASAEPLPFGGRAGADGVAHVARLAAGPWRVTARAPGFDEANGRASADGETVSLVLRKLGAIDVHVVSEGERPASDARVEVSGAMLWPPRAAETDGHGDVRIGGLAAGTYALRATWGDRVSPIELGVMLDRGEEKSLTLRLVQGRFVGVRVTDGDGDDAPPIEAARVSLAEGGLSPFPLEATTDAAGRARLGPIAPGGAALGARADGFVARGAIPVGDPPPPETRIALVRAGVLTGRVVDARGYPIDGATIEIVGTDVDGAPVYDDPRRASFRAAHFDAMLAGPTPLVPAGELGVMPGPVPPIPAAGAPLPTAGVAPTAATLGEPPPEPWVTRDDGTFRASPASPGRIRAIVHHPQYVEAQSEVVTLAPGGEAHVEIVMHQGGSLEGRVLDTHDRPVAGARVSVAALRGTMERTTRTADDGTFAFAALPVEVSLTASADPDQEEPDVRLQLAVPEGDRKEVTLRLPPPRDPVAVTVVDDRDFPVAAAQVSASSLAPDAPLRTTSFTDADGAATLRRAHGLPLRIEVTAPGHAPKVVTTDGSGDSLRVELAPAESATGSVVTSRGGDPIAGAEVTLYTDLGVRRAHTDAQGEFAIAELAPGSARLRVRAAGYAPVTQTVTIPDGGGRRPFDMPRVELAEEGIIEGDVVDAQGNPVAGARVGRGHVSTWLVVGQRPEGVAVTDANGHFVLHGMPEGAMTLEAYAPDVGRGRAEGVKVVAGRTTDRVEITLRAGAGPAASEPASSGSVAVTLGETTTPVEVVIVSVDEASEAERAGLAPGDVVLAVDGTPVHTMEQARARMNGPVSDDVVVQVRRGDRTLSLRVTREAVHR